MNGSKMARYASSLAGLPSGGGPSKQGLLPTVGLPASIVSLSRNIKGGYCCLATNKRIVGANVSWKGGVGHRFN